MTKNIPVCRIQCYLLLVFTLILFVAAEKAYMDDYNTRYLPQNDQLFPAAFDPNYQQILEEANQLRKQSMIKPEATGVKAELNKLNSTYSWQTSWPKVKSNLGEVSAVAFDVDKNVVLFHRGDRVWNQETFGSNNVYQQTALGPIPMNTIAAYDRETGSIVYEFGKNTFFMPHGLTIDQENNFWVTDVALHQIMKFSGKTTSKRPDLILGTRFEPGNSNDKFCKPTAVAVLSNGDFFVSDGYCNSRIMKFSKTGELLLKWGRNSFQGVPYDVAPENYFAIPHALTLALDKGLLCVADRENGRIQCFHIGNGTFHSQYHSPLIGDRLFGVAYTPIRGGQFVVINGPWISLFLRPEHYTEVLGFVIDMKTKAVLSKFGPNDKQFNGSHDVIVSPDGTEIYVAVISPNKIYKFKSTDLTLYNGNAINVKPTANFEGPQSPSRTSIQTNPVDAGATALLVVSIIVLISILIFGMGLLISKRRKRGCLQIGTHNNRRHAWDFPTVKTDTFKLGHLLDRKRGFEKLNQEASDEEPNASTTMLSNTNAQFA